MFRLKGDKRAFPTRAAPTPPCWEQNRVLSELAQSPLKPGVISMGRRDKFKSLSGKLLSCKRSSQELAGSGVQGKCGEVRDVLTAGAPGEAQADLTPLPPCWELRSSAASLLGLKFCSSNTSRLIAVSEKIHIHWLRWDSARVFIPLFDCNVAFHWGTLV